MANTFEFIGKIVPCKETEKFKPYGTERFPNSDWGKKFIKFNMVCGTNRHLVEVNCLMDCEHGMDNSKIFTFSKGSVNSDGTTNKGEKMTVDFKDRFNGDIVEQVANFKKFVLDTEYPGRRFGLEKLRDRIKDGGEISEEESTKYNVNNLQDIEKELEISDKRKHVFISEYDYIDALNKFVNNEEIKNMKFRVRGTYELDYNEKDDKWYRHFYVQSIYRAKDEEEPISIGKFVVAFDKNAVEDTMFEETKKIKIIAYVPQYLGKYKKTFFAPIVFTIDGTKDEKMAKFFAKKFNFPDTYDDDYRELGVVCDILDGAQIMEITYDDLTEEQKENVDFGLCTLDDIRAELGGNKYGDRVTDIIFTGLGRGYTNGSKPTKYVKNDFCKPHNEAEITKEEVDDIFGDIL